MNKNSMLYVGLDLGDKFSYITIVDQDGALIEESRLPTTRATFQRKFATLQPCRVAMEVGAHSRWASHLLRDLGHEVLVANARKLRAIYNNPRKGDRADAETLARLARLDPALLSPIHHRSPQAQTDLAVLRSRDAIVRSRTLLINHARSIVKSTGARLPACSADSFAHKAAPDVPIPLRPALAPILDTIASLTQQIKSYDQKVEELCSQRYPETSHLREISGVGPLTSLGFILTLEHPDRFPRSRQVGPALGLVPRRDQSGDQDPQLRITPGLARQGRQDRRPLPAPLAGWISPVHPGAFWAGLRPAPLGISPGRTRGQERQEESRHRRGQEACCSAPSPVEDRRDL